MAQIAHAKRQEKYGTTAFQSKYLLTGMLFCGYCGARYYKRNTGRYSYYTFYSRSKQIPKMVKDPHYKNRNWKAEELEPIVEEKVQELLHSPWIAEELMAIHKQRTPVPVKNIEIEKRICEIDRQINKLMDLYQRDDIPVDLLGNNINKLYNEKLALQTSLESIPVNNTFDLVQELIADASQIWDFADEAQKRRILQSLIHRITLKDDDVKIEWVFES